MVSSHIIWRGEQLDVIFPTFFQQIRGYSAMFKDVAERIRFRSTEGLQSGFFFDFATMVACLPSSMRAMFTIFPWLAAKFSMPEGPRT